MTRPINGDLQKQSCFITKKAKHASERNTNVACDHISDLF